MRKYIKWILLVILIISLIITSILFINFASNREDTLKNETSELDKFYGKKLRRIGVALYKNDELISENLELTDLRFMVFNKNNVTYCDMNGEKCDKYDYLYEKDVITINSEDYFITNGTYEIEFTDNRILLTQMVDDMKMVHYLEG